MQIHGERAIWLPIFSANLRNTLHIGNIFCYSKHKNLLSLAVMFEALHGVKDKNKV